MRRQRVRVIGCYVQDGVEWFWRRYDKNRNQWDSAQGWSFYMNIAQD